MGSATEKLWAVSVYGFDTYRFPGATASAAKYAAFKAIREAGYFSGRDGFWRFIANGVHAWRVRP